MSCTLIVPSVGSSPPTKHYSHHVLLVCIAKLNVTQNATVEI